MPESSRVIVDSVTDGSRRVTQQLVSLDALAGRWRTAFGVAADALETASGCRTSLGLSEQELAEHKSRLVHERDTAARLLTLIAHEDHIELHRSLLLLDPSLVRVNH
jgi:hypothetical protein